MVKKMGCEPSIHIPKTLTPFVVKSYFSNPPMYQIGSLYLSGFVLNLNVRGLFSTTHIPVVAVQPPAVDHSLPSRRRGLDVRDLCESALNAHFRFEKFDNLHISS